MHEKVEKIRLEDGRHGERRVKEMYDENKECSKEVKTEYHVEEKRPLYLEKVVTEKTRPVVYERIIETIDPTTGNVVQRDKESTEPEINMQLRESLGIYGNPKNNPYVTKEDLREIMVESMTEMKRAVDHKREVGYEPVRAQSHRSVSAQSALEERVATKNGNWSIAEWVCAAVILAQSAIVAYLFFG
jgi:hypothetical protein